MFSISKEKLKELNEWLEKNPPSPQGAIGGSLTYSFTPTTLGVVIIVKNNTSGKEIDLSNYREW